jgi:hypothetical protein
MSATTAQHIAARDDIDLIQRFIAKAEMMGLDAPGSFVQNNIATLISVDIDTATPGLQTVTDVYAYAAGIRQAHIEATPPAPGLNPAAVTDEQIEQAINVVRVPPVE